MKTNIKPHLLSVVVASATLLLFHAPHVLRAAPPPVSSATLTAWLDAGDINGDGSVITDGASVAAWVNKAPAGIGNFGVSSGGTVSPIYVASSGAFKGLPVVRFKAGIGKWLTNTVNLGNNVTVIYVGRKNGSDSGRLVTARSNNWLLGYWGTNMGCSFWGGVGNYQGTSLSDNKSHVWVGSANGTQFFAYRAEPAGESQIDTGTLGQGPNALSLGSYNNGAEAGGGDIGELLVYNGALSQTDRTNVEAYLVSKWIPILPTIDVAPQSITVYAGEYASVSVVAAGLAPLSYQWRKNDTEILGATNAAYSFSGAFTAGDSGAYTVVVTNSLGSVTSAPASVVVLPVTSITNALAAYWPFDDTTGTNAADATTNGNTGVLINYTADNSQWIPGQVGGALRFAGASVSNYVFVANYPKPSATMTISAWVWADVRPSFASIIKNWPSANQQFHFGIESTAGDLSHYLKQQGGTQIGPVREGAGTPLPTNSWHHVALVCDGQFMRLYRNGLPVGAPLAYNGTIVTNPVTASLSIGAKWMSATSVDSFWQGRMDDLGLWTRALPADQIFSIYKAGTNAQPLTTAAVGNPPEIPVPPQAITRFEGEYAQPLFVTAFGTLPLFYQWRKDGADLPGQTSATLPLNQISNSAAGLYTVVVSNAFGMATSAPAAVVVQPVTAITDGLAGYWNFDEGAGTLLVDYSGNGNDGALMNYTNDLSRGEGRISGALSFGGAASSNYVVVPNYPKPNSTMTIALWAWADARPAWASLVKNWPGTSNQFHLGLDSTTGDLSNYLLPQSGSQIGPVREGTTNLFPLGSWQHVALVCDGMTMRLYRNATLVSTLPYNGTIQTNPVNQALAIGAKLAGTGLPTSDASYWQGKMDDLGLWTRGLSADEILAIVIAGLNGHPLSDAVVGAAAPTFATPPQSQTVTEGDTATLTVLAAGTPPLSYQWFRNGTVLSEATNTSLTLSNLCRFDGADFSVVVCNVAGCVTSALPATLTVAPLLTRPITDDLMAHWAFDETSGTTAADSTAFANHGYLTNFPGDASQWVRGQIGGALNFRGPGFGDYVLVPDYPKPTSNLTISAWIWAEARPTWASIVKNWATQPGGDIHFGLNNVDGDLSNYLIQQDGGLVGPVREGINSPFPLGSWQHVALVCDGSKQQIYRNGVPVGAPLAYNGTINTNLATQVLAIGAKVLATGLPPATSDSGFWQGRMDDLGFWHRGLTGAEIQAVYNAGLDGRDLTEATVRPSLRVTRAGSDVTISWPAAPAGNCFVLEWTATLPAASWTPVGVATVLNDGRYSVTLHGPTDTRFYRLMK